MPEYVTNDISQAVLHTLMYSDVFDYPLTAREVHHFLHGVPAIYEQVLEVLKKDARITNKSEYYMLAGREGILDIRKDRESRSRELLPHALKYGRFLGNLPFVRMVALTGSLAVMNISGNADFDYMIVTTPGRLWTARAFVLLFGRFTKLRGHTICPNLLISANFLEWKQHDLYSARELCQMIPISGAVIYQNLMKTNGWVKRFLPNAKVEFNTCPEKASLFQGFLEACLRGQPCDRFEAWEMNRKVARFSQQEGFGEETVFNAEICQGNFDHHRHSTQKELQQRMQGAEDMVKSV